MPHEIQEIRYNHYLKNLRLTQEMVFAKAKAIAKLRQTSSEQLKLNIELSLDREIEEITRKTVAEFSRKMSSSTRAKSSDRLSDNSRIRRVDERLKALVRNVQSANSRKYDKRQKLRLSRQALEDIKAQKMSEEWESQRKEEWRAERKARQKSEQEARSRSRSIQTSFIDSRLAYQDTVDSEQKEIAQRLEKYHSKIERSTVRHSKALQTVADRARSCSTARDLASRRRLEEDGRLLAYIGKVKFRSKDDRIRKAIANQEKERAKKLKEGKLSQVRQRLEEEHKRRLDKAAELDLSYDQAIKDTNKKHQLRERSLSVNYELKRLQIEDARQRARCQHRAQLYKQELLLNKHVSNARRIQMLKQFREERSIKRIEAQRMAREQFLRGLHP